MSEEKQGRRSRVAAAVPEEKKIIPVAELNKIHAEQFRTPKKSETFERTIQTASGATKIKHYETKTYPNGQKKQRLIKVVKIK